MELVELLQCAKPLIFENSEADFRYSIQGTCFVACFRSHYYAITAQHCLRNRISESIRIRMTPGDLNFISAELLSLPQDSAEDSSDLAFLKIAPPNSTALRTPQFLEIGEQDDCSLTSDEILAVVGFPTDCNSADYESLLIKTQMYSPDGRYAGPAEDEHCSIIRFNNLAHIDSLDGLSGSPVLSFQEIENARYKHRFAGVLIRGTKKSGLGRFINATRVIHFLKQLHRDA